jgi:hypothetical protein
VILTVGTVVGGALTYALILGFKPTGSSIALSVKLNYEDGTSKTVESGLRPLTIMDTSGKKLSSIDYAVNVYANWEGTATSTAITGSVDFFVSGALKYNLPISYNSLLPKTQNTQVKAGQVTASLIESWSASPGDKTLVIMVGMDLKITFDTGTSDTRSGEGSASFSYKVQQPGLTVLTVTVSASGTLA